MILIESNIFFPPSFDVVVVISPNPSSVKYLTDHVTYDTLIQRTPLPGMYVWL